MSISRSTARRIDRILEEGKKELLSRHIVVAGSAQPVRTPAEHNLIHDYRFMVHPIVVGSGNRICHETVVLKPVDTKRFRSGIAVLTYQPGRRVGQEAQAQQA